MATVTFNHKPAYPPFNLDETSPAVVHASKAVRAIGLEPTLIFSNGGLDANWLDKAGVPTVTIGAGQYEIHTLKEYVDLPEFAQGCRLAVALATMAAVRRDIRAAQQHADALAAGRTIGPMEQGRERCRAARLRSDAQRRPQPPLRVDD
eukprot:gene20714-28419_t